MQISRLKKIRSIDLKHLIFQTSLALTITSGLSYVFGFVRDKALTYTFGASAELDVYNAAFVIPEFILAIFVTSALSAAFVPIFTQLAQKDKQLSVVYANQVLLITLFGLIGIGALIAFFLPLLAPILVPGFSQEQTDQYISMTRILLLTPLFFTASNVLGGVLISMRGFFWYGIAPILYNIGIIIGIFLFVPSMGIYGLAAGAVLGTILHMTIRWIAITHMKALYWKPSIQLSDELRQTAQLMLPKMFQIGMWQVLLFWFIRLASQLPEGSITIYSLARNFQSVPVSLIGIALALGAFSTLSHLAAEKKFIDFDRHLRRKSLLIIVTTLLTSIVLALVSQPLIQILFGGGKFDSEAVHFTAAMLAVYCLSIPFESLMHLLARAHYALKNTFRPSIIHIVAILIIIMLSAILITKIGLFAIPVSFAIGLVLQVTALWISYTLLFKAHVKNI